MLVIFIPRVSLAGRRVSTEKTFKIGLTGVGGWHRTKITE